MRIYLLLAMATGVSFIGSNCGGTGIGDPCTPEDEYLTAFSGFSPSEVNVESRSFQCLTRVCLVNHFQGRVSCPYGQVEDPSAPDAGFATCMGTEANRNSLDCQPGGSLHLDSCQVPDRDGSHWEDRIVPEVAPQLVDRQAEDAVYCSCRCAPAEGEDEENANFCECPSGFACTALVDDLGFGAGQLAGSYCIKEGTEYVPGESNTASCNSSTANCNKDYTVKFGDVSRGRNQKAACLPPGAECGKDATCCNAEPTNCVDKEDDPERNCFTDKGCATSAECDHSQEGEAAILETMYAVERKECKEGSTCP